MPLGGVSLYSNWVETLLEKTRKQGGSWVESVLLTLV